MCGISSLPLVDDRAICICAANIDSDETSIPSAHVRGVVRRSYKEKVAKIRNRQIIYRTNAEIAFLPPFDPGVFLLMAIYRLALEKWHAICNTCYIYIYYTTNNVPYDDLYLSGNQSDDMSESLISESHLSSGMRQTHTHTHTCILYNKSHAICGIYLSDSTCPTTFRLYVRDDNHSVVSVKYPSDA